ncbi:AAA family ATPase [Lacticaseibacillus jixiensis]|uniref:AAA family ATPase n=1 Tax=Lacticaseibacillus jixiensis TaxID=3231926 RepID=UPI0036F3DFC4
METQEARSLIDQAIAAIDTVVQGSRQTIALTVACLLAGGHVLFEDVPGVGKTTLARTLAKVFAGQFARIQFTPDLLPSDITGVNIYNRQTNAFEFRPGPVFTNFLLADEINRATPRTQAALLEAMGEAAVTTDGVTRQLGDHFFVMATQNPQAYAGTYPLPEAQLDRFMMTLSLGYPSAAVEVNLLANHQLPQVSEAITQTQLEAMTALVQQVHVSQRLLEYVVALANATRNDPRIQLGISPRASLAWVAAARAWAVVAGRDYVVVDDLQYLAQAVLQHRLVLQPAGSESAASCLTDLIGKLPVPLSGDHS